MARVAITGARLLDGTGAEPVEGRTILWEAGVISWIGPDEEAVLERALLIPAEGGTVLPGLIDSHVHLSLAPTVTGIYDIDNEPVERTLSAQPTAPACCCGQESQPPVTLGHGRVWPSTLLPHSATGT